MYHKLLCFWGFVSTEVGSGKVPSADEIRKLPHAGLDKCLSFLRPIVEQILYLSKPYATSICHAVLKALTAGREKITAWENNHELYQKRFDGFGREYVSSLPDLLHQVLTMPSTVSSEALSSLYRIFADPMARRGSTWTQSLGRSCSSRIM